MNENLQKSNNNNNNKIVFFRSGDLSERKSGGGKPAPGFEKKRKHESSKSGVLKFFLAGDP
jgi:hypothetical protein